MRHFLSALLLLLLIPTASPAAEVPSSPDWPQWRGPARDGQAAGKRWPQHLNEQNFKRVWRVELGPSYSGPIIGGDLVFTTETKDAKTEAAIAFDRRTGK